MKILNQQKMKWMQSNCILFSWFHSLILNGVINPENPEHEIMVLKDSIGSYVVNTSTVTLNAVANHYKCSITKLTNIVSIAKALISWKAIVMGIEQKNFLQWEKDSLDGQIDDITPTIPTAWTGHAICVRREWLTVYAYDSLGGRKYKVPNVLKHIVSKQLRSFVFLLG